MRVITKLIRQLFIIFIFTLLTGCSIFSPVKTDYTTYVINTMPDVVRKSSRSHKTLYVSPVTAEPLFATDEMAYTASPYQVEYFAKNRWAEDPAKMLQPLVVRTLQKTHHFHAVTFTSGPIRYDYILNVHLLKLIQVFRANSSYEVATIYAEIVNAKTGRIIAAKEITTEQTAYCRTPFSGVIAANKAVAITLQKLARFCLKVM